MITSAARLVCQATTKKLADADFNMADWIRMQCMDETIPMIRFAVSPRGTTRYNCFASRSFGVVVDSHATAFAHIIVGERIAAQLQEQYGPQ